MIFVWVEEDYKDSQIFTAWMHVKFVERSNNVQSSQILAFLYMSKSLVYQWQEITILFNQSIKLSVIDTETQTFVFLFRLIASSRVLNSSRLDSSQNSWLKYLSQVKMFNSSIQVESESWNWVSTWNSRFDLSRHEDR